MMVIFIYIIKSMLHIIKNWQVNIDMMIMLYIRIINYTKEKKICMFNLYQYLN